MHLLLECHAYLYIRIKYGIIMAIKLKQKKGSMKLEGEAEGVVTGEKVVKEVSQFKYLGSVLVLMAIWMWSLTLGWGGRMAGLTSSRCCGSLSIFVCLPKSSAIGPMCCLFCCLGVRHGS